MYWDPLPTVVASGNELVVGSKPRLFGPPEDYLCGQWELRDWRNVPGPFYGAGTDTCQLGRGIAPDHVVYEDDQYSEVVFRQPRTVQETYLVLTAAWVDPFRAYACDGDDRWTWDAIREWWSARDRLGQWLDNTISVQSAGSDIYRENAQGLRGYRAYLNDGLDSYLRNHGFWLDHHRAAQPGETLPALN
ncbi:ferredoxin [Nocardia sp. BMG111209]|uniref:ferredoxin n=1 Tax=Nocardia sp. BMG111209 TaxID=1160137 RepID=UPI0003A50DB4|nr:ferredoxin [Nocardia sp. BMG111209]